MQDGLAGEKAISKCNREQQSARLAYPYSSVGFFCSFPRDITILYSESHVLGLVKRLALPHHIAQLLHLKRDPEGPVQCELLSARLNTVLGSEEFLNPLTELMEVSSVMSISLERAQGEFTATLGGPKVPRGSVEDNKTSECGHSDSPEAAVYACSYF